MEPETPAAPAPAPAPAPAAAPAQSAPKPPQAVTVPMDQFERFLAAEREVAEARARDKARESTAQREAAEAEIKKGLTEKAMETLRTQHEKELAAEKADRQAISERSKRFVRDKELAVAATGLPFTSPHAARQFIAMVAPQLEAHAEGDSFVVRTATFLSPEQLVASARNDPQYAHFFLPTTTGGPKPANSHLTTPTPPAQVEGDAPAAPKNLGEAIKLQWQQNGAIVKPNLGFSRRARPV